MQGFCATRMRQRLCWCDVILFCGSSGGSRWIKCRHMFCEVQICVDVIRMEVLSLSPTVRGGKEQKKVFKLLRFSAYSCLVWKELFSSLYSSSLFEEQRNINIILVQWNLINYPSNREDIFMTFCCKEKLQEVPYLTPFFRDEKKHRERWCGGGRGRFFVVPLFLCTSPFLIRDFVHRAKKKETWIPACPLAKQLSQFSCLS